MKCRHWKRLFIGWVLVNLLLSTPAMARYCGSGGCWDDDGGLGIKPWMLVAEIASNMLSGGDFGGCTSGP